VLIVDDDADSADLLVQLLEMRGHEVRSVHSATDAVAEAAGFLPHVAILDVGLPDMSGYELAQLLRKDQGLADCKLIAVTGYGKENDKKLAREAGFDRHLSKPVEPDALLAAIDELLVKT
jgi:CheY-like chemotaxis protein